MSKRSKEKDIDVHYSTRVVIVGNAGVGKSALLGNLSRRVGRFSHIFRVNDPAVIGIHAKDTIVEKNRHKVRITWWDAPGSIRHRATTAKLCSGCAGIIFVFDVTDRQSFTDITEWMKLVENAPEMPFLLVGNKIDSPRRLWQVTAATATSFALLHDCAYLETSALSGGPPVDRIFEQMADAILDKLTKIDRPTVTYLAMHSIRAGKLSKLSKVAEQQMAQKKPLTLKYVDDLTSKPDWL